jgi:hypothetical protein
MGFSMTAIYMDFRRNYELSIIYIYNNLIKVITRTKIILYIMVYELKKRGVCKRSVYPSLSCQKVGVKGMPISLSNPIFTLKNFL